MDIAAGTGEPLCLVTAAGFEAALPTWAQWFIDVGARLDVLAQEGDTKLWICITVPDRRFAAVLVAFGAIRSRLHHTVHPSPEERFEGLEIGAPISWLDTNKQLRCGSYDGASDGYIHYRPRVHGGIGVRSKRPIERATEFWPMGCDEELFVGAKPIAQSVGFCEAAYQRSVESSLTWSDVDTIICGTSSVLEHELTATGFSAGGHVGCLADVVRPRRFLSRAERSRSAIVTGTTDPDDIDGIETHGPAIFDGPQAYVRLRESVCSTTNLIIIDRWSPRATDTATVVLSERAQTATLAELPTLPPAPPGVELLGWVADR
jgi:hypothetical protein